MTSTSTAPAPTPAPAGPADRPPHHRVPGGARPDGGHHQPRLPPAVPRVRPGGPRGGRRQRGDLAVRQRDDHVARPRRAHPRVDAPDRARPRREPPLHPALRRRPGHRRGCRADAGHRGPRRPHRPQLRLPRAEGDAQGRRCGAALEARPVRGHRHRCGPRGRSAGRAGHRQDAQGHRRRAPHLPRGRAHRRAGRGGGGGAARADSWAGVLRAGRLERHRPAEGDRSEHPGPGQR